MPLAHSLNPHPEVPSVDVPNTPPPTPNEEFLQKLTKVVENHIVNKHGIKPDGWSKNSRSPYFKPHFGEQMKAVLDEMMEDKKTRIYRYEDYPNMNPVSLHNKIIQSRMYVCEKMDPDGKYKQFCQCLSIHKKKGVGIVIAVMMDIMADILDEHRSSFTPTVLNSESDIWHDRVMDFIDNGPTGQQLHLKNLALEPQEIEQLKTELGQLSTIALSVSASEIKIVKMDI